MIAKLQLNRLIWLTCIAVAFVGIGMTAYHHLKPSDSPSLKIEEALWVKDDGILHPPGSPISQALIDHFHPDYIDFDEMRFSGPVLLLHDHLGRSPRTPLIVAYGDF